jgi:hypothetical protein
LSLRKTQIHGCEINSITSVSTLGHALRLEVAELRQQLAARALRGLAGTAGHAEGRLGGERKSALAG